MHIYDVALVTLLTSVSFQHDQGLVFKSLTYYKHVARLKSAAASRRCSAGFGKMSDTILLTNI